MNEFKLHKNSKTVSWKAYDVENAYSSFDLTHEPKRIHDARLIVTECYCPVDGRAVVKEAWITLTPEDLDALANAAMVMAEDIRVARACKAGDHNINQDGTTCLECGEAFDRPPVTKADQEKASAFLQHRGDLPHGISCAGCFALRECNECGRALGTTQLHNVRIEDGKRVRDTSAIGCMNGRCPLCCTAVCKHSTGRG